MKYRSSLILIMTLLSADILASVCEKSQTHIRWMIRRDMAEVLTIADKSFEDPASEELFIQSLRQRNIIAHVAEDERGGVNAFMFYELHKNHLKILKLAVHPDARQRGIASAMIDRLIKVKLSSERRNRLTVEVRESNLVAQQFFREMGFRAIDTLKDHYDRIFEGTTEDAYLMEYRYQEPTPAPTIDSNIQENRINPEGARTILNSIFNWNKDEGSSPE